MLYLFLRLNKTYNHLKFNYLLVIYNFLLDNICKVKVFYFPLYRTFLKESEISNKRKLWRRKKCIVTA